MRLHTRCGYWLVPLAACLSLGTAAGQERLAEAVKTADIEAVRVLIEERVDLNSLEADGTTALHWAVHRDDLDIVDLLIRSGANVRVTNRYGVAPLALACINGNAAMVERLLASGADANTSSPEGETALMAAARTGNVDAVEVLLAHGGDVRATENWRGTTALMWATAEGNTAVALALLERGADVHAHSTDGFTPLLLAVRENHVDTVNALLEAGANVHDTLPDGTAALVLAIINANHELATVLLERGADPNVPDPRGSALHALAWMRRPGYDLGTPPPRTPTDGPASLTLAEALLAHGANPNAQIAWKEIRFSRSTGTVKQPPDIKIGRNFQSAVGATPFFLAAKHNDVPLMRLLAANGADPLLPTAQRVTPLMAAAGLGFWDGESPGVQNGVPEEETLEAVTLAWELGNDVNTVTNFGDTPVEGGGITLLLSHPLNIADFDPETDAGDMRWGGSTALHGAVLRGANSVVQFLVDKGAAIDATNKLGWTPLMIAEGIFTSNSEKTFPNTAALLRRLMNGG